jgi:hypothetical protein
LKAGAKAARGRGGTDGTPFNSYYYSLISTNNIAIGMVRDRHKYAFNPPKIRFHF